MIDNFTLLPGKGGLNLLLAMVLVDLVPFKKYSSHDYMIAAEAFSSPSGISFTVSSMKGSSHFPHCLCKKQLPSMGGPSCATLGSTSVQSQATGFGATFWQDPDACTEEENQNEKRLVHPV